MGARDTLTVSAKGQVVIPQEIRQALGITPGSVVEAQRVGDTVSFRLKRARRVSTVEEGFGMLKYHGPKLLKDFDVVSEMRRQAKKAAK